MTLSDFLLMLIGVLGAGLLFTALLLTMLLRRVERKIAHDLAIAVEQVRPMMIPLDVEQAFGIYYCYNSDNQEFICQGRTVDEVRESFRKRFPYHTAVIAGGQEQVVSQFRQAIAQEREDG